MGIPDIQEILEILEFLEFTKIFEIYNITVPQSKGDPKILKRGAKRGPKRDSNNLMGVPKFDFFRIVHKEQICTNSQATELQGVF